MKNVNTLLVAIALAFASGSYTKAFADDSVGEKVGEAANDTKRAVKKAGRNVKKKSCELVNGKMECAKENLKDKAKNLGDKVEDATD